MVDHPIASRAQWLEARKALLLREKEQTRLRDAVNAERLALPWVKVEKEYAFDTPDGRRALAQLFDGRSQLVVYHFMLAPGWEAGCKGCSFVADHLDGTLPHLNHHDVTLLVVSRAPLGEIERYKQRMGWRFPWVSSNGSEFNYDYQVSLRADDDAAIYNFEAATNDAKEAAELPGLSAFVRGGDGTVYHSYSIYARGVEELLTTYMILDRAPLGRNETEIMGWMRRHDEYEDESPATARGEAVTA